VSAPGADLKDAADRPLSIWQTLRAVAWSFFGVRRSSGYAEDVQKLNPVHVIVGGLVAAVVFVLGLVALVRWIVGSGVAQV
jgi:amino acid transporter